MIWGNGQFYMAPRIDKIHDRGVPHWVDLGVEHGFAGPHVQCAGLPLHNMGLRALVKRSRFSWLWVWPDTNWVPDGAIMPSSLLSAEAKRYYSTLHDLLGDLGTGKFGFSVGSDPHEWTKSVDVAEWADYMRRLFGDDLLVGARSHDVGAWAGTYAGWGNHFNDKDTASIRALVLELVSKSNGRPCLAGEDRLRDRTPQRLKDFTQAQQIAAMPVFVRQGAGAIWGVLGADSDGRHESGTLAWDDPAAVREALGGGTAPPPGGSACDDVADQSAAEMARHGTAMNAINVLTRALCGSTPPPPPPGGNDLAGITVIGVSKGWQIPGYEVTTSVRSVDLTNDLEVAWPDQGWPESDIGPFPSSNPHHGRVYIVSYKVRKMWGVEWLRRPGEATSTTVHPWIEDGFDILETLIEKAKGDAGQAGTISRGDELGIVIAAPHLRERSAVLKFTA